MSKTRPSANIVAETPFPDVALPLLWMWVEQSWNQVADDFTPQTAAGFIADERARAEDQRVATFAVYRDHEIGGFVRVVQTTPIACEAHCIFSKNFWGYQTTLPALNEVARQLFELGITRISMPVFSHNSAIRSLIKRAGGTEEGTLKEMTVQNGLPVDLVIYRILKREWEALNPSLVTDHSSHTAAPAEGESWEQQHRS
jgi:RimJ/RimL family protein N-acetyltransferase